MTLKYDPSKMKLNKKHTFFYQTWLILTEYVHIVELSDLKGQKILSTSTSTSISTRTGLA